MSARKYVLSLVGILYVLITLSTALWHGLVKTAFTQRDLNRLGSFITTESLTEKRTYPKHHAEFSDYSGTESFDVITIGDSFSNSNNYQDYLVNEYGLRILNCRFRNNCLADLYILLNSGILDQIKPRAVILECVERSLYYRLGEGIIDPSSFSNIAIPEAKNTDRSASGLSSGLFPPVMFQANLKFIADKVYHLLKPEQLSPEVYIMDLDRPFFTNPGYEDILLVINEDLHYLSSPVNVDTVNHNLNTASRLLKAKGITLIFFAAADKYDLYYPYITHKHARPQNSFFPNFRNVPDKEYIFIDTLKLLREALELGEQDIYWFGDTHWSHKGIKLVCDELVKYIPFLNQPR